MRLRKNVHVKRKKPPQSWRLRLQMQLVLLGNFSANFSKCGALGRGFVCSPAAGLGSEIRQFPAQSKQSCDSRKTECQTVFLAEGYVLATARIYYW